MCHVNSCDPRAETSSQIRRIQNLMLALLPRFVVSESILRELTGSSNITSSRHPTIGVTGSRQTETTAGEDKMEAIQGFFQVACHLVLYARNIVSSHGVDHRASSVIFKPSLAESLSTERRPRGNVIHSLVKNMLTRWKESDTYLATVSRHHWSPQIAMKVDKVCSFQPALQPSSAEEG